MTRTATNTALAVETRTGFVPVPLTGNPVQPMIRLELRGGAGTVIVQWPVSAAADCVALLRELTR